MSISARCPVATTISSLLLEIVKEASVVQVNALIASVVELAHDAAMCKRPFNGVVVVDVVFPLSFVTLIIGYFLPLLSSHSAGGT